MKPAKLISNARREFLVTPGEQPKRLDAFISGRDPSLSRNAVQKLIEEGSVTVNAQPAKSSHLIRPGETIAWDTFIRPHREMQPESIPLEILFEDDVLLVLNKPAGLVVHPSPGHRQGTLMNALLQHLQGAPVPDARERPGLVHRLDKDTSGVMVIAKTDAATRYLAAQFSRHTISRVYEAFISGVPRKRQGRIELGIGPDKKDSTKFSIQSADPKPSVTDYKVIQRFGKDACHVLLYPGTGRTHQLRVHLSALGHPIHGDATYGGSAEFAGIAIPRVMLHARALGFRHPNGGKMYEFTSPLPKDMATIFHQLERKVSQVN